MFCVLSFFSPPMCYILFRFLAHEKEKKLVWENAEIGECDGSFGLDHFQHIDSPKSSHMCSWEFWCVLSSFLWTEMASGTIRSYILSIPKECFQQNSPYVTFGSDTWCTCAMPELETLRHGRWMATGCTGNAAWTRKPVGRSLATWIRDVWKRPIEISLPKS